MNRQNVCFARAYGEPREAGAEIGRQLADEIREAISALGVPERFEDGHCQCCGLKPEMIATNLETQAPELLAEMEGLAEGAGVPAASIFMMNWLMLPRGAKGAALAFADAPGGPAVAVTLAKQLPAAVPVAVTAIDVPGRAEVLLIGAPGLVGCVAGVNSHGIAMTLTPVESNESRADGLPSAMVARMALQQSRTLDEALAILEDAKLACCPWDAILADKERAVLVARGLDNMAVREAVDGAVWAADSYGVRDKLARLAAEKPHTGEGVQEALVDCGEPDPICACGIGDGAYVFGAVVRPRARVIRLAAGEPCKTEFRPFQLKLAVTGAGSHLAGEYQQ